MKPAVYLWLCAALACGPGRVAGQTSYSPEEYGATADDGLDDRAAIQQALDAAAVTGGTVVLGEGVYHVQVVVAKGLGPVTGYTGGLSGYHGLLVPPGCTLTGAGRDKTVVRLRAANTNPNAIGDGIINGGYQTALEDFGAGGGIRIAHLRVDTPDVTFSPTGNLIGLAHADGVVIADVALGSSRAHALEINVSRNVVVENCLFDGEHPGSSSLQLDFGAIGAKSLRPTGTVVRDILVRGCVFTGRSAEVMTTKVIELGHTNSDCILRNVAFEDCYIEGLSHAGSACVAFDNPPTKEASGLRFERCHFHGIQETPSVNGLLNLVQGGSLVLQDLTVRNCRFTGAFTQGIILNTTSTVFNTGHAGRRGLVVEGNTFTPRLDRAVAVAGSTFRMLAAAACAQVTVRRNLFEFPATAANLTITNGLVGIHAANCLDCTLEDNIFTWAHATAAQAPIPAGRLVGINAPVYQLEEAGVRASVRITGNQFLYPPGGIGSAISMATAINTTAWAAGGPWVDGLVAGNFASGAGAGLPWLLHHDLSGAGNIGQVMPAEASRTAAGGWYACSGTPLTALDSGRHQLARVNAVKCGYSSTLPSQPGTVVRLTGPLRGEGLLAGHLSQYAGSTYWGTCDTIADLAAQPFAERFPGELQVVRQPLGLYRWESEATSGSLMPADKPEGAAGYWIPFDSGMTALSDDADPDRDGLTNAQERAFLRDPLVPESPEVAALEREPGGSFALHFRCATGPNCPRICVLSSDDLSHWNVATSCPSGGAFPTPAGASLTELPSLTGRLVKVEPQGAARRFWKVVVEP